MVINTLPKVSFSPIAPNTPMLGWDQLLVYLLFVVIMGHSPIV